MDVVWVFRTVQNNKDDLWRWFKSIRWTINGIDEHPSDVECALHIGAIWKWEWIVFVEERGWKDACLKGFNRKERSHNCCGDWGKCEEKWKYSWIFFSILSGYGYGFIIQQTPTIKQHHTGTWVVTRGVMATGDGFWCRVKNIVDGEEYCIDWVWADGDFLPNIIDRLGIHVYLANGWVNGLLIGSLMRRRGRGRVHKEGVYDSMGPVVILCVYGPITRENGGECDQSGVMWVTWNIPWFLVVWVCGGGPS